MAELFSRANIANTRGNRAALLAAVGVLILLLTTLQEIATGMLGVDRLIVHIAAWLSWLYWLAIVFPRGRARALATEPELAYRRTLFRHVLPGFAAIFVINFSPSASRIIDVVRAGRPGDLVMASPIVMVAGVALAGVGGAIVVAAIWSIGLPAAAFAEEYEVPVPPQRPVGIYAVIRHPICVGGMLVGCASALWLGARFDLVAVNLLMLTAYAPLEDLRLRKVFGPENAAYVASVGRFVPSKGGSWLHLEVRSGQPRG